MKTQPKTYMDYVRQNHGRIERLIQRYGAPPDAKLPSDPKEKIKPIFRELLFKGTRV